MPGKLAGIVFAEGDNLGNPQGRTNLLVHIEAEMDCLHLSCTQNSTD